MNNCKPCVLLLAAIAAGVAIPAAASGPLAVCQTGVPYAWPNGGANIVYNPETGPFVGDPDPLLSIRTAFDQWENVSTSTISYIQGATIPDVTGANILDYFGVIDGLSPIMLDDDGTIAAALGFPPGVLGLGGLEVVNTVTCDVVEGLYIIFAGVGDVTGFRDVATHEAGHFNNLGHTVTNGQIYLAAVGGDNTGPTPNDTFGPPPPINSDVVETMYPFYFGSGSGVNSLTLHPDDVAFISTLYPEPGFFANSGTISGTILAANGVTKLSGANVIARNIAAPFADAVSAISGDFTDDFSQGNPFAGVYTINGLTPGADYAVYVDQILAGGFGVPPLSPLPGPEEFWNGADESNFNPPDDPSVFTAVAAAAGSPTTGIDIIFNQPAPGDPLPVGDDGFVELAMPFDYTICGQTFGSVFVNANGNLTFGSGDTDFTESAGEFLSDQPRIAALWDDLSPFNLITGAQQGLVTFDQTPNTFTVIFEDVPEFLTTGSNSFEITLHRASNNVDLDYGPISIADGLAGISCGGAITSGFEPADDLTALQAALAPGKRINMKPQPARYEVFSSFSNPNDLNGKTLLFNPTIDYNDTWAEPNDSLGQARRIKLPFDTIPVTRFSEIEPAGGDVDYYRFRAMADTTLVLEIIAGELDSLIGLFDPAGNLVDFDDDGGVGLLSRLVFPVTTGGEYSLAVTTFADFDFDGDGFSGGRYVLDASAVDGYVLDLGDDGFQEVPLGFTFPYQGSSYTSVFVNANGNLTFGSGDTDFSESVSEFLNDQPRIAALWDDLNTSQGGQVNVEFGSGTATVNFIDVPEWFSSGANTFSVTMAADGSVSIAYGSVSVNDGIVGVTQGGGATDPGETDLSAGGPFSAIGTTYERFTGVSDPFDLDGQTLDFEP